MGLLDGKVALISGVGRGLGGDAATLFAEHGAKVVLFARSPETVADIAQTIRAAGGDCATVTGSMLDNEDCHRAVATAVDGFGQLDILVNVAGKGDRGSRIPLLELDEEFTAWRESYEINVIGTMKMTRAAITPMVARRSGKIVMVNSMTGEAVRQYSYAYSAAKGALQKITQVLALELAPKGIRVNGIHPGFMWGPVVQQTMEREAKARGISEAAWLGEVEAAIPLGYVPPTMEYAKALLFLASDLSDAMTGASLHVNGGQYIR